MSNHDASESRPPPKAYGLKKHLENLKARALFGGPACKKSCTMHCETPSCAASDGSVPLVRRHIEALQRRVLAKCGARCDHSCPLHCPEVRVKNPAYLP